MFETTVTVVGRLVTPLKQVWFADGSLKVSGRMACTERRFDRAAGQWTDGQTLFVTVVCKRGLAENAFSSLRSGDPVMAHGRLYTREYEKDGVQNTLTELEAWSLGPDLQRCTAVLTKKARAAALAAAGSEDGRREADGVADEIPWDAGEPVGREEGEPGVAESEAPGQRTAPPDDPWSDPRPAGVRTGEAAVGV